MSFLDKKIINAKHLYYKIRLEERLPKAYLLVHSALTVLSSVTLLILGVIETYMRTSYLHKVGSGLWTGTLTLIACFLTFILGRTLLFF